MDCWPRIRERPPPAPRHAECQEASSQDHLNSKGVRNGKSPRYSLHVESLTSTPRTDRRGKGTTAPRNTAHSALPCGLNKFGSNLVLSVEQDSTHPLEKRRSSSESVHSRHRVVYFRCAGHNPQVRREPRIESVLVGGALIATPQKFAAVRGEDYSAEAAA
jgi:hypothetical protein